MSHIQSLRGKWEREKNNNLVVCFYTLRKKKLNHFFFSLSCQGLCNSQFIYKIYTTYILCSFLFRVEPSRSWQPVRGPLTLLDWSWLPQWSRWTQIQPHLSRYHPFSPLLSNFAFFLQRPLTQNTKTQRHDSRKGKLQSLYQDSGHKTLSKSKYKVQIKTLIRRINSCTQTWLNTMIINTKWNLGLE